MPSALFQFILVIARISLARSGMSIGRAEPIKSGDGMCGPGYSCQEGAKPVVKKYRSFSPIVQRVPRQGSCIPLRNNRNPVDARQTS